MLWIGQGSGHVQGPGSNLWTAFPPKRTKSLKSATESLPTAQTERATVHREDTGRCSMKPLSYISTRMVMAPPGVSKGKGGSLLLVFDIV